MTNKSTEQGDKEIKQANTKCGTNNEKILKKGEKNCMQQIMEKTLDILASPFVPYKPKNNVHLQDFQNEDINENVVKIDQETFNNLPTVSQEELEVFNQEGKIIILIDNMIYDVTNWGKQHPGGEQILRKFSGTDATEQFYAFHRPRVANRLEKFLVGTVQENKKLSKQEVLYKKLRQYLWKNKYFEASEQYYNKKYLCLVIIFLFALFFAWNQNYIICAVIVAQFIKQGAFIAHDSLHYGIIPQNPTKKYNMHGHFFGSVIFGISSDMWNEEHTMHHAITRRPMEDPQFNYLPICLISYKEITWKGYKLNILNKFLISIQQFTFFPLAMIVGRFNLHIISLVSIIKNRQFINLLEMILYFIWYGSFVMAFEYTYQRVIFVLISYIVAGILHIQLLINHLGVDAFTEEEERQMDFFTFQLKTSRNIITNQYTHWFSGGLQWQIEHHLFPELPRHNLRLIKPAIQEICNLSNIEYNQTGFFKAIQISLQDLNQLSIGIMKGILG